MRHILAALRYSTFPLTSVVFGLHSPCGEGKEAIKDHFLPLAYRPVYPKKRREAGGSAKKSNQRAAPNRGGAAGYAGDPLAGVLLAADEPRAGSRSRAALPGVEIFAGVRPGENTTPNPLPGEA